jgi:hypothetical protein
MAPPAPAPAPIQTEGAPPSRHADRVTAEMMRYLVAQSTNIRATVRKMAQALKSRSAYFGYSG